MTPAAAGKHIRRLEELLGTPLFVRTPQGMILTDTGARVVAPFQVLLNAWDDVQRSVGPPAVPVRIGALPSLATTVLPRLLWVLNIDYGKMADVAIYPTSNLIRQAFLREEIDLGLLDEKSAPTGCRQTKLFRDPLVVVMNGDDPLAQYCPIPGELLDGNPIVMFPVGCDVRQTMDHWMMTRGVRLNVALEIPFGGSLIGAVRTGQAITVMPLSAIAHEDTQRITMRPLTDGPFRQVVAIARSHQWEPALTTCSQAMIAYLSRWATAHMPITHSDTLSFHQE
ncbi:transcriptional regulator, LysR family, putative [Sulfobacillus acidophilus TPY]|nr:transcriptional regulator, LysR family, putative [Sulfobacillus acidophilus TPY]